LRKKVSAKNVSAELLPDQSLGLLKELHLLTRNGELNADARRKLKQINHFVRFLQPAFEDIWKRHKNPVWVDVSSGNSYLGFIIYEVFLKNQEKGKIFSIDSRGDLIERSKMRAQALGFDRMEFQCSKIQKAQIPDRVHILTALHACDTASDEAILLGIEKKINYLFIVPCCQAEVAHLLQSNHNFHPSHLLYQDPHHRREFASHLTNVLRVLTLRSFGYKVRVTELTSWEHTAKGELIIAQKVQNYHAHAKEGLKSLLEHFSIEPQWIKNLTI